MYDYVIVGAGSAGCVLANRLSEDPDARLLLLEAGPPDRKLEIHVPVAGVKLFNSSYDWDYASEPSATSTARRPGTAATAPSTSPTCATGGDDQRPTAAAVRRLPVPVLLSATGRTAVALR